MCDAGRHPPRPGRRVRLLRIGVRGNLALANGLQTDARVPSVEKPLATLAPLQSRDSEVNGEASAPASCTVQDGGRVGLVATVSMMWDTRSRRVDRMGRIYGMPCCAAQHGTGPRLASFRNGAGAGGPTCSTPRESCTVQDSAGLASFGSLAQCKTEAGLASFGDLALCKTARSAGFVRGSCTVQDRQERWLRSGILHCARRRRGWLPFNDPAEG